MPKYHPCSKEFQEETKRLGLTGNQLIQKYIQEGKLPNSSIIHKDRRKKLLEDKGLKNEIEYIEHLAKNKGFKNRKEQRRKIYEDDIDNNRDKNREWHYINKGSSPMPENENCTSFAGVFLGENIIGKSILIEIFGNIEQDMPYGNHGYEYVIKGGYKVEIKTGKLLLDDRWIFNLGLNSITDYFLLIGLNNAKTKIIHVWLIKRGDIIKKRVGEYYEELKIYKLDYLNIGNNSERLSEFQDFEITDKLVCIKEINDMLKEMKML